MADTTTCERCGAESDGLTTIFSTIVVTTPLRISREYACRECVMRKRDWRTGELGEPEQWRLLSLHFEPHLCERCGQKMLRVREGWRGQTLTADRFCRECAGIVPKERAAERARLSRQARRDASGTPTWACKDCGSEITGRVFWAGSWSTRAHRCEACEREAQVTGNRSAWEQSVKNGTPGHYAGFLREYKIPNPDDFAPDLDTEPCEVCQREVDFVRPMTERRTIRWCGEDACYAGAVRLAKRVEPAETRPCERRDCPKMHSRKRGAKYCTDLCRALASRERRVVESGG